MSTFMLSARHIAFDILKRVDSETQTLDHWLDEYREPIDRLNRPDRALVHALVYGALRWQGRLDWIIDQLAVKPGKKVDARVRIALRIGLFQLLHLERIPASAAVNTTVDLVKACGCSWAKGFVNSMLRIVSEKRRPLDFPDMHENPVLALSIKHAFPVWLIERWQKRYGIEQTDSICAAINAIPPITLRVNTIKVQRATLIEQIKDAAQDVAATSYSPEGIVLRSPKGPMAQWPSYENGFFQIQSEGSQLIAHMLDAQPGHGVWDACAGLGTKTAQIAQLLQNQGDILATDVSGSKLESLGKEMRRLGIDVVSSRKLDLAQPRAVEDMPLFDRILLDAPCSGLGVLQKNPDGKWRTNQNDLKRYKKVQATLIRNAAGRLKPSGILVYAVCSMEPEETTGVIKDFLQTHPDFAIYRPGVCAPAHTEPLMTSEGFLATQPHRHHLEGFFAAALVKHR